MRITAVETTTINMPYKRANRSHHRANRGVTRTLIVVRTDDGIVGLGESRDYQSKHIIDHVLAPVVIGEDPLNIAKFRSRLLFGRQMPGVPSRLWETDPWAYSGFEMALYDIAGKAAGVPVSTILGGQCRTQVPFVAYFYPQQGRTSPEAIAEDCQNLAVSSRAQTLELKVGVLSPQDDIDTITKIRKNIGASVSLRIDANGAWSVGVAMQTLNAIERLGIANVEEPCLGLAALAWLRKTIHIPISTHHADVGVVAGLGAADNIVFDLPSEGGIGSARACANAAEALGLGFWMRSTGELGIGTAAILHLAASTPSMTYPNQTVLNLLADDIIQNPFEIRNGLIEVPDAPGLGVELDEAKVEKYARLHSEEGTYRYWEDRSPEAQEP
jgi:glucarate dehydratase